MLTDHFSVLSDQRKEASPPLVGDSFAHVRCSPVTDIIGQKCSRSLMILGSLIRYFDFDAFFQADASKAVVLLAGSSTTRAVFEMMKTFAGFPVHQSAAMDGILAMFSRDPTLFLDARALIKVSAIPLQEKCEEEFSRVGKLWLLERPEKWRRQAADHNLEWDSRFPRG